jgi:hypothetical protein
LWFDLCWEIGGFDEYPFPISVPSHGETFEERAVLKQRAIPEMQAAGLLAGDRLASAFGQVLAQIAKPGLWVEGLWMPDDVTPSPARLMSIVAEQGSILLVQAPGRSESFGGDVQITVQRDPITAATLQGMPPAPPGNRPRVAVPVSALAPKKDDEDFDGVDLMQPQARGGRDAKAAAAARSLVETEHFRDGQFTVNLRDRMGRSHRSAVFKWFDGFEPDGRYGVTHQQRSGAEPELVVAPVGAAEIRTALQNRVDEVRSR